MEKIEDLMQKKIISFGILLIIFFSSMGFVFWRLIKDNDDLARMIFVQIIALILFMFWVSRMKLRKTSLNQPILFYAGANLLALFVTSNIYESLAVLLRILIYLLIFLLVVNNLQEKDVRRAFVTVVIMGFIISAIGVLQYFGMDWFRFLYPAAPTSRVFSILGNPDFLGGYLALILPLALILLLNCGLREKAGIFGAISFFVIMLGLFLTGTRSALVAFGGSFIFLSVLILLQKGMKRFKRRWSYILIISLVIFFALGFSGRGRIKDFFFRFSTLLNPETLKADGSVQYRLSVWRTSIAMFKDHPVLGVGPGVFKLHYPIYQANLRTFSPGIPFFSSQESRVHNEYLQTLAETGIIGTAAFLWLAICIFYSGLKYLYHTKEPKQKNIIIGLLAAISAIFLDSIFAFPFHLTSHATLFWLFLGMLVVVGEGAGVSENVKIKHKPGKQRPWELIIGAWTISVILIVLILRSFFGTFHYKQAIIYGNQGMDEAAMENYLRAIRLSPFDPEIHFTWGYVCLNNNNVEEAFKQFQLVEKLYPYSEDNLLNLGFVYNLRKMPEKAIDYFKRALLLNPNIGVKGVATGDLTPF